MRGVWAGGWPCQESQTLCQEDIAKLELAIEGSLTFEEVYNK